MRKWARRILLAVIYAITSDREVLDLMIEEALDG